VTAIRVTEPSGSGGAIQFASDCDFDSSPNFVFLTGSEFFGVGTPYPSATLHAAGDTILGSDFSSFHQVTGSMFVTGSGVTSNYFYLITGSVRPSHLPGQIFWDDREQTVTVDLGINDTRLQVGQEQFVYGRNTSTQNIAVGDVIKISGAQGDRVTFKKAISNIQGIAAGNENEIIGIASTPILINQFGYVTTFGIANDMPTNASKGFVAGDVLFLSNTVSGAFTKNRPPAPYDIVPVGIVVRVAPGAGSNGIIFVKPSEPVHMNDISGITGSNIPNGTSYWRYESSTGITALSQQITASSLTFTKNFVTPTTRITQSIYTASVTDYRIGVRYTSTGSVFIKLPKIFDVGARDLKFKDEEGNAQNNNITIVASGSDLIDGSSTAIMSRNYMAINIYNDGINKWFIE